MASPRRTGSAPDSVTSSPAHSGESIERDLGQLAPGVPQSVGTHMVRMDCDNGSFGMTLANCGKRDDGVVVLHVDPDGAAFKSGVMVGDVLLAIGSERNLDLSMATRFLRNPRYETVFEFAGASRSRMLVVPNPFTAGHNGVIIVADCACGIGVFVKFVESWTGPQRKGAPPPLSRTRCPAVTYGAPTCMFRPWTGPCCPTPQPRPPTCRCEPARRGRRDPRRQWARRRVCR